MEPSKKGKTKQIVEFAMDRIHRLQEEISEKSEEIQAWESVLAVINACDRCHGAGELRVRVAQDETEVQRCEKCKGKGVRE